MPITIGLRKAIDAVNVEILVKNVICAVSVAQLY